MKNFDVVILGAGAAGLMCGATISQQVGSEYRIAILDGSSKPGKKLLACGGGKGNLTNLDVDASFYCCENPYFPISALRSYSQYDSMEFFESFGITWDSRECGRLYTNQGTQVVLEALLSQIINCQLQCNCTIHSVELDDSLEKRDAESTQCYSGRSFTVQTSVGEYRAPMVVVATGGISFRSLGASDIGYTIAKQFGHTIISPRPALSPFVCTGKVQQQCNRLAGVSLDAELQVDGRSFTGPLLFTHFGLSGLVVLQSSLYWRTGMEVTINLLPSGSFKSDLEHEIRCGGAKRLASFLRNYFSRRLVDQLLHEFLEQSGGNSKEQKPLAELSRTHIDWLCNRIHSWRVTPESLRGFSVAEVTAGGVDTQEISSKTMESKRAQGLYFIGEVLDVTGELGGFNLQWAWSSAVAAARAILRKS